MIRNSIATLLLALSLRAQQPVETRGATVDIATENALCSAIAEKTICLRYVSPSEGESFGVFEPGLAALRLSGLNQQAVTVSAIVISQVGRQWLKVRRKGQLEGGNSLTEVLPVDIEVFADETELADSKVGRFVAILTMSTAGGLTLLKLPVELTVTGPNDALRAEPDSIPSLNVRAIAAPSRYFIAVSRPESQMPALVSVTPETSDGGNWLATDMRPRAGQCADVPAPCSFEVIVKTPATAGTYWGVLVISSDGFADRIPVRLTVEPAPELRPVTIEPREISLSTAVGSRSNTAATVKLRGGNYDGIRYRATHSDPWLSVDPPVGTWPATVKVVMRPFGLEPGVYTDAVVLRSVSSNEVLASFIVRFNVTAPVLSPAAMDGGGWRTRLYLVNPAPVPAKATLTFWTATNTPDGSGAAWAVKLAGKGFVTRLENELIPAGGLRVIETEGTQNHLQYGWVEMQADGPVSMYSVLSEAKTVSKWLPVDATVPILNSYRDHLMIPFDNLNGGTVSVSLANVDGDPITVEVTVLNENGAEIAREGRFTLDGREGKTIMAAEQWTSTAGRRGLLSFRYDGGRLLAIGLRALGKSFHAYPAIACNEIGLDRGLPSVSVGGAWESTAYFANTTSQDQFGLLRLWSDKSRLADVPLSDESAPVVPANGILTWQAPYKGKSQPAGGWLETQFSKQVSGFMLLRQSYAEAALAVPVVENYESVLVGQHGLLGRTAIPYDNRQSYSTRIVLVNLSDIATDIQPVAYDLLGRYPRFLDAFRVPARGQLIVDAATYGEPSTPQGIIQFTSRQGVPLTGAGLRFGDGALTILPAYEQ